MRPRLAALSGTQGGLFTRRQALECGYSASEQRALLREGGTWHAVRRGVYARMETWTDSDDLARLRLVDRAAQLNLEVPHLLSHDSAARAWGIPMLRQANPLVHVTRVGVWGSRTDAGIKHHLTRFEPPEAYAVEGLVVAGIARTALDLGREHGYLAGLIACDHALSHGLARRELMAEMERMWCWPQVQRARAAVLDADSGAETIAETLGRTMAIELDAGPVETQFPVRTDGGVFWCDLRVGAHLIEVDGRGKYIPSTEGGLAETSTTDVVLRERTRQNLVMARGLGMSRLEWRDLIGSGRRAAMQRLRAEYEQTRMRLGDHVPEHLEREAAELRASRRFSTVRGA